MAATETLKKSSVIYSFLLHIFQYTLGFMRFKRLYL